jgi:hypothetical protein
MKRLIKTIRAFFAPEFRQPDILDGSDYLRRKEIYSRAMKR